MWDEGKDCSARTWDGNNGKAATSQVRDGSAKNKAALWALLLGRRPPAGGSQHRSHGWAPILVLWLQGAW